MTHRCCECSSDNCMCPATCMHCDAKYPDCNLTWIKEKHDYVCDKHLSRYIVEDVNMCGPEGGVTHTCSESRAYVEKVNKERKEELKKPKAFPSPEDIERQRMTSLQPKIDKVREMVIEFLTSDTGGVAFTISSEYRDAMEYVVTEARCNGWYVKSWRQGGQMDEGSWYYSFSKTDLDPGPCPYDH